MKLLNRKIILSVFLVAALASYLWAGQPAARLGDYHTCPAVTNYVPHVGGPITTASPSVIICGQPAARLGDAATCNGPIDQLVLGSTTVRINGKPAVRLGDPSAHGGVVVEGCSTVLIGP